MKSSLCERLGLVFVLNFINLIVSERPRFRNDYRYEKAFNAFYKLHVSASTWSTALVRCQAEGAQLMVPESFDEADIIPYLIYSILPKFPGAFVGVHDIYSERYFVTIDGFPASDCILDLLWTYEEPVYGGGRCVGFRRDGNMFVHPCNEPLPFICKVAADQIKYYTECNTYDPRWKLGISDSCFFLQEEPQTWHIAYSTCLAAGGYLAIINSREEALHLKNILLEAPESRVPNDNFAFIGFNDLHHRYHYRTIFDKRLQDMGFVDWDLTCKDTPELGNSSMRCGGFLKSGLLATGDCDTPAVFFCEKSANASIENFLRSDFNRILN